MKKVLLASTALLLTAGYASAEGHIAMSMDGAAGITYNSENDAETGQLNPKFELDINFEASGTTDAGLEFGAKLTVDEVVSDQPDDIELFISGTFGTITMGMIDPATDRMGLDDIGLFGIGIDDISDLLVNATAGADVLYEYELSGLEFAASAEFGDDQSVAAVLGYDTGVFSVAIGYIDDSNGVDEFDTGLGVVVADIPSNQTFSVGAGFSQGPIEANALYSDWSTDDDFGVGASAYGLNVAFDTGAATVSAMYSNATIDDDGGSASAYGVGFEYPLGGGLAVEGGIGIIDIEDEDSQTVGDFGVSMSF